MAEIPVPIELLSKLNLDAMRKISGKIENKEVKDFKVDPNAIVESKIRRKPMNASTSKMPKAILDAMLGPTNEETDKLWSPSTSSNGNSDNGYSNGLSKSILSEEREPSQNDFDRMREINKKLSNKSNKNYPSSTPVNQQSNGYGQISEDRVRELIREEVYRVLGDIVKQEGENRLNEETIRIKIGNSIFSGNLTPITKLKNK